MKRVLMISTDQNIFKFDSSVKTRMVKYASELDELFIIILGKNKTLVEEGRLKFMGLKRIKALFYKPVAEFDLVTAQDPFENGFIAWCLAIKIRSKLELQVHTDLFSPYFSTTFFLNRIRLLIARFLLPKADQVRVVSQRIADSFKTVGLRLKAVPIIRPIQLEFDRIRNSPITIDLRRKYPQFNKIILMASRLTREKNIKLGIEAMVRVIQFNPRVGLIIVGSGPEERHLRSLVLSSEIGGNVIFEPWSNDLPSYYKTADLFLNTSWYEGYGLTLVEAQTAGCPVIVSTDVGIARELGLVISDWNPIVLSKKIIEHLK